MKKVWKNTLLIFAILLVTFLAIKLFFFGRFCCSTGPQAVDYISPAIIELSETQESPLMIYPSSHKISVKKGRDPVGFAILMYNNDSVTKSFEYQVSAVEEYAFEEKCEGAINFFIANTYLVNPNSVLSIDSNENSEPILVLFDVPESAPNCYIPYEISVSSEGEEFGKETVWVTIK